MIKYPSISGIDKSPLGNYCFAFLKLDGSNIRAEYNKKTGWTKFGTRNRMLDQSDPDFGCTIPLFLNKYSEGLNKILRDNKEYREIKTVTVFFEFFGKSSFGGLHDPNDEKDVVLFDINFHKKGFISPKEFIKNFNHLGIPDILYEGNFNLEFIKGVKEGKYGQIEGVVAKGNIPGKKHPHNLWSCKVKTNWWLNELKARKQDNPLLCGILDDNLVEQFTSPILP